MVSLTYISRSSLCWGLTSQSTIFQSCRDGATASWVINQYFRGVKCLASRSSDFAYILKTIDIGTSYFVSMNQYDQTFDLKINVGQCDLYSTVQWFCLISWRLFDAWTLLFGIMSQYDPKFCLKNKYRSLWHIFYGPVILRYILKTIWCMNINFGIKGQYGLPFDLKINVGLCDLYFMVQWLCLISPRLFSDNETVWPKLWPQSKYKSIWPIFHGLVILLNIFKIIRWMNIIVGIMDQCDTYIDLTKYM